MPAAPPQEPGQIAHPCRAHRGAGRGTAHAMPRPFALAPFGIRSYRFQWPADLLVSWAFEMEVLILGWYVLVETGSVLMLTIYGSLLFVGTLIAPLIGVASDRLGHRQMLSAMRAVYALVAATLLALAATGRLDPAAVLVLAAVSGLVRPSDLGMRGALIAETMPPQLLTAAMGISRTTSDTARIAGALAGAGLFTAFGIAPAYVFVTAFYLAGTGLTWMTAPVRSASEAAAAGHPAAAAVPSASPLRDLREGLVHIWNTPSLLALVWMAFLFNFSAFSITNGMLPYVAKDVYLIDQTGLGTMIASLALGATAGALALAWSGMGSGLPRLMIVSSVIWHALLLVFAQMTSPAAGTAILFAVGIAQSLTMVAHTVLLLNATSQRLRGRVMGVRMMAIYSLPLGLLAAGVLTGWIGFAATGSIYALTGIAFTIVIAVKWRHLLWRTQIPRDEAVR